MPKYDRNTKKHLTEDIASVVNVQGLTTTPEGPKFTKKAAPKYKKNNEIEGTPRVMSFKEWIDNE